jgi:Tol biopolymer transport system component
MGEVYRARDTRLDRSVAIKIFKQAFTERFEREAQAIAALNHPNICTLHDIGREGDVPYLVMELIDGVPLAGPMALPEAIGYALQTLDALHLAHRAGIIHRDLKPANILKTRSGVKLLDFGLAKRVSSREARSELTITMSITGEQSIVGTLQYMAPEQLEGKDADERSDIFAFGCVFYEMLTGQRVFHGTTPASVIAAVMSNEPRPISDVGESAGRSVELLIRRCLEKRPEDRWQTAQDLRAALRMLSLHAGIQQQPAKLSPLRRRWLWVAAPAFACLLAAAGWYVGAASLARSRSIDVRVQPLATADDLVQAPAWSPDGKQVAYASFRNGNMDIWRRTLDRGAEEQITSSPYNETDPVFSPDGRMIAISSDEGEGGVFLLPASGGVPTRLTAFGSHPAWSPDGQQIAFDWSGAVYTITVSGGQPRKRLAGTGGPRTWVDWSPDGRKLILWHRALSDVTLLDLASGKLTPLALVPTGEDVSGLALAPGGGSLVLSRGPMGGNKDLWLVPLNRASLTLEGRATRLTLPLTDNVDCRFAPDGKGLAFAVRELQRRLWSYPVSPETGSLAGDGVLLTPRGERNYYPAVSPDGRTLAWTSQSGDNGVLYFRQMDATGETKLTQDWESGAREVLAAFSPDSQQIAYASTAGGAFRIWRMPSLQSVSLRLTENEEHHRDTWPAWSRDGKQIAFHSTRTGNFDIWIVSPDGAGLRKITDWPSNESRPAFSPEGKLLGFMTDKPGNADLWAADRTTGRMFPLVENPAEDGPMAWSPNGQWLYFVSNRAGASDIWMQSASGGQPRRILESRVNLAVPDDLSFSKFEVTDRHLIVPLESRKSRLYLLTLP